MRARVLNGPAYPATAAATEVMLDYLYRNLHNKRGEPTTFRDFSVVGCGKGRRPRSRSRSGDDEHYLYRNLPVHDKWCEPTTLAFLYHGYRDFSVVGCGKGRRPRSRSLSGDDELDACIVSFLPHYYYDYHPLTHSIVVLRRRCDTRSSGKHSADV